MQKQVYFIVVFLVLFSCKTLEKNKKVIVKEKFAVEQKALKKTIKLEPSKHYKIIVETKNDLKDTVILNIKNREDVIIGSTLLQGTTDYFPTFEIVCRDKKNFLYKVEIFSKNGNLIKGKWTMILLD